MQSDFFLTASTSILDAMQIITFILHDDWEINVQISVPMIQTFQVVQTTLPKFHSLMQSCKNENELELYWIQSPENATYTLSFNSLFHQK